MLKKTLTNYIFLGLLFSVRSEGGYPVSDIDQGISLAGSFKDKCSELLDQSACTYWNSLQDDLGHFQSTEATGNLQQEGLSSENITVPEKSEFLKENSDEEHFVNDPFVILLSNTNKRFSVFRRRNPNGQSYKRGPGFRSWGGKRDFQYVKNPLSEKAKFISWAGNRDDFLDKFKKSDKRSNLVSWGGNRDFDYSSGKNMGFKSWGRKRIPLEYTVQKKTEILNPFKRNPIWKNVLYLDEPYKKHFPKRPQFQSWGGKRALYPLRRFLSFFYARPISLLKGEKRKFSSWGGKRSFEIQSFRER